MPENNMNISNWISENTESLAGKTVAVTGSTGGLGRALCDNLASLGASLVLVDRNEKRSALHGAELKKKYGIDVRFITCDMEDFVSVKTACEELKKIVPDILILNAGAYKIPRRICETGFDNSFQINFVSPYYLAREMLPTVREKHGRIVAVGSVAHNYSKSDPDDIDFRNNKRASRVYGNAKRYLMCSLWELFKDETEASLSVVHPGITVTNITTHYPKPIYFFIKYPMKLFFMSPKKACLSLLRGVFEPCEYNEWIGPRRFNVWGFPKKSKVTTCTLEECREIGARADRIYYSLKSE